MNDVLKHLIFHQKYKWNLYQYIHDFVNYAPCQSVSQSVFQNSDRDFPKNSKNFSSFYHFVINYHILLSWLYFDWFRYIELMLKNHTLSFFVLKLLLNKLDVKNSDVVIYYKILIFYFSIFIIHYKINWNMIYIKICSINILYTYH